MTGADLRAWRKRLGLSQAAAAVTLGVSRRTYIRHEMRAGDVPRLVTLACRAVEYDEALVPSLEALLGQTARVRSIVENLLTERVFLVGAVK